MRRHRIAFASATAALAAAGVAPAAVNPPHVVTVGLSDNSVFATGYTPADGTLTIEARRGNVLMARASAQATLSQPGPGFELSVNGGGGPGDACWDSDGVTPDLSPGDSIRLITSPAPPAVRSTEDTAALPTLTVGTPAEQAPTSPGVFHIEGAARQANGIPVPLSQLRHELRGPVDLNGLPVLNAPGQATFAPLGIGTYRLVYTITSPLPAAAAMAASTSLLTWTSPLGSEVATAMPGPDAEVEGCSAPLASDAATEMSPSVINLDRKDQTVVIKGFSRAGATLVNVTIDDLDHPETPPITVSSVPFVPASTIGAGGTWTVSFPTLSSLVDGRLAVSVGSVVGATEIVGPPTSILKDLVPPAPPVASVAPGLVAAGSTVSLASADAASQPTVRYTLDGSVPDATSTVAVGPISIPAGGARIRAVAFDPAGNRSAESAFSYVVLDAARNAVVTAPSLTARVVRSPISVSGVAQVDATAVDVRLISDGVTVGPIPATLGPVVGANRAWTATVAPVLLRQLADGPVRVSATISMGALSYTTGVAPLTGGVLVVLKDTRGPKGRLRANIPPGTFLAGSVPRVRITGCLRGSSLRYTTDGSEPLLSSPRAMPVAIRDTFVRIRAACLDSLGNPGAARSFAYRAIVGRLPSAPRITASSVRIPLGRARLAGLRIEVPVNFVEPTRIRLLSASGRVLVDRLGAIVPGQRKARLVLSAAEVRRSIPPGLVRIVIGPHGKTIEVARLPASVG